MFSAWFPHEFHEISRCSLKKRGTVHGTLPGRGSTPPFDVVSLWSQSIHWHSVTSRSRQALVTSQNIGTVGTFPIDCGRPCTRYGVTESPQKTPTETTEKGKSKILYRLPKTTDQWDQQNGAQEDRSVQVTRSELVPNPLCWQARVSRGHKRVGNNNNNNNNNNYHALATGESCR